MLKLYLSIFLFLISFKPTTENKVVLLNLNGTINPASADYIINNIKFAENENASCLIIELNTPGGLLSSTREIVSHILESNVPIVVYVYPKGSRAASAGVFITLSSNIAAMAPGTNIGAAHPVSSGGQMDSTMSEKVTNDAAAFIRTISQNRKRNMKWAEEAVRKSISITETEAVGQKVVNLVADNLNDLLIKLDSTKVETADGPRNIYTDNAQIIKRDMSFTTNILNLLSDPNISYILLMLGFYGLLFELFSPGAIFPGVFGGICLIIGLYALSTLPINYAGLALIIFGIVLFVLEIKIVSHGILTIGGIISLVLGSLMLINIDTYFGSFSISWQIIATVVVLTVLFFLTALGLGIKAQRRKPTTGWEGLIDEEGETTTELNPEGFIRIHGELWDAESIDGFIDKGTKVSVKEVNGLQLKVTKSINK
jgi:membrane-bound serine protease (ClpP class)